MYIKRGTSILEVQQVITNFRKHIADLLGIGNAGDLVLCPGQLISLSMMLCALNVRLLLISTEEYYAPDSFPGILVHSCPPSALASVANTIRPDAILLSVVSWRGNSLGLADKFSLIKNLIDYKPLLIADYAHAGAIGFPDISTLNCDLIVGDLNKWLLPLDFSSEVAFLYPLRPDLAEVARRTFAPFYCAYEKSLPHSGRWLDFSKVKNVYDYFIAKKYSRSKLIEIYRDNLTLTANVARDLRCRIPEIETMIWLKSDEVNSENKDSLEILQRRGLVWEVCDAYRIMCSTIK